MVKAMTQNTDVRELNAVKKALTRSFEKERWNEFLGALEEVSRLGEKHARIELSMQAQSLNRLMIGREQELGAASFREVSEHFDVLVDRLSHLAWTKEF